jgi:5-formyltetrahydrofolate cyclo-ligase
MKANPDAPQLPVRRHALRAGKTVYVAVPRLRETDPFLELDPERLADEGVWIDEATTVRGSSEHGISVHPDVMPEIDLVVSGSVAVTDSGARVGKGEGYADLKFASLTGFDRVSEATVATTVHPMQVVPERLVTPDVHDVPLRLVVTPDRARTTGAERGAVGIDWDALGAAKRAEIPILRRLYGSAGPYIAVVERAVVSGFGEQFADGEVDRRVEVRSVGDDGVVLAVLAGGVDAVGEASGKTP